METNPCISNSQVGYTLCWRHYGFPDGVRLRCSWVLTLPTWQRLGIATHMLTMMYQRCQHIPRQEGRAQPDGSFHWHDTLDVTVPGILRFCVEKTLLRSCDNLYANYLVFEFWISGSISTLFIYYSKSKIMIAQ